MTTLRRVPNEDWFACKDIPVALRDADKVAFGVSQEERFRLPPSVLMGQALLEREVAFERVS